MATDRDRQTDETIAALQREVAELRYAQQRLADRLAEAEAAAAEDGLAGRRQGPAELYDASGTTAAVRRPPDVHVGDGLLAAVTGGRLGLISDADEAPPAVLQVAGPDLRWGKVIEDWAGGNTVAVHPCERTGDNVDTDRTVTVYLATPTDSSPQRSPLEADSVVAYLPAGHDGAGAIGLQVGGTVALGTYDTPDALYATYEGVEAAQTDTWDRASPDAGTDGLTVPVVTRVVYDEGNSEVLYGYYRTLTFDSDGALAEVSAETRFTIDTPEAC